MPIIPGQIIEGILFEPVGCLAEFPSEPFHEIAARFFDRKKTGQRKKVSRSASRSYWHLLNLMEAAGRLDDPERQQIEALELQAVEGAAAYEDVSPALTELQALGVKLLIASSLSNGALTRFLSKASLCDYFSAVWGRDNGGGVKSAPLARALTEAPLRPAHTMFLTDTAEGLKVAKTLGVNAILMMNDPDEAKRLSTHSPAGGIVSLHELPDFVRFVAANNAGQNQSLR